MTPTYEETSRVRKLKCICYDTSIYEEIESDQPFSQKPKIYNFLTQSISVAVLTQNCLKYVAVRLTTQKVTQSCCRSFRLTFDILKPGSTFLMNFEPRSLTHLLVEECLEHRRELVFCEGNNT